MTKQEYLLSLLCEECAEVTQRATKIQRFGLDEIQSGQLLDNKTRLEYEIMDLISIISLLQHEGIIPKFSEDVLMACVKTKKSKVSNWMEYSKKMGTLE